MSRLSARCLRSDAPVLRCCTLAPWRRVIFAARGASSSRPGIMQQQQQHWAGVREPSGPPPPPAKDTTTTMFSTEVVANGEMMRSASAKRLGQVDLGAAGADEWFQHDRIFLCGRSIGSRRQVQARAIMACCCVGIIVVAGVVGTILVSLSRARGGGQHEAQPAAPQSHHQQTKSPSPVTPRPPPPPPRPPFSCPVDLTVFNDGTKGYALHHSCPSACTHVQYCVVALQRLHTGHHPGEHAHRAPRLRR